MPNINTNTKPFIPKGWTIESHEKGGKVDTNKLALHWEPEQKSSYLSGIVMRECMKGKGLNAVVLDYFLAHPKLIPDKWKGNAIFFWGTIYRCSDGRLVVRCLCWNDGRWVSGGYDLGGDWSEADPALVRASALSSVPTNSALKTLALEKIKELQGIIEKM